jgi:hypothetical protein
MEILVYNLGQSLKAAEAIHKLKKEKEVSLVTLEGAGGSLGIGICYQWQVALDKLYKSQVSFVVDCGNHPGRALSGLRVGLKRLRCLCHPAAFERLRQIAQRKGSHMEQKGNSPILDLLNCPDPHIYEVCQKFLTI